MSFLCILSLIFKFHFTYLFVLKPKFEGTCLDLALEGERLCRIGECELGVQYLESALSMDNKDLKTLSAIYNQLGNAYLFLQNYSKSLEYYKQALDVSRLPNIFGHN